MGVFLPLVAALKRAALVLNIQDLHPEALVRLGVVRNSLAIRVLREFEAYAYRRSTSVTGICDAFREHVIRCGGRPDTTVVIENWVDTERLYPDVEGARAFRREIGF